MDEAEVAALPIGKHHDMRPLLKPNAPNLSCRNCNACTCHAAARVAADCLKALKGK